MRLSWSVWLALLLLCGSGCEGDNCGPTSDWPTCNNDSTPSAGDPGEGTSPPKGPGGGLDGAAALDAGTPTETDSKTNDAGVDARDAGDAALDLTWIDASTATCTADSGSFATYLKFLDTCAQ